MLMDEADGASSFRNFTIMEEKAVWLELLSIMNGY